MLTNEGMYSNRATPVPVGLPCVRSMNKYKPHHPVNVAALMGNATAGHFMHETPGVQPKRATVVWSMINAQNGVVVAVLLCIIQLPRGDSHHAFEAEKPAMYRRSSRAVRYGDYLSAHILLFPGMSVSHTRITRLEPSARRTVTTHVPVVSSGSTCVALLEVQTSSSNQLANCPAYTAQSEIKLVG